jgi:hypothetical protein
MPFCAAWILGIGLLVVAALLSIVPGGVAYLLARKKKSPVKEMAAALAAIGTFLLVLVGYAVSYERCAHDFYCERGFDEYRRIPISEPYQIVTFRMLDEGCLNIWHRDQPCIVSGITHYAVNGPILVGRVGPTTESPDRPEWWFSFNFDTGHVNPYNGRHAFVAAWQEFGFEGEPALRSIRAHYLDD